MSGRDFRKSLPQGAKEVAEKGRMVGETPGKHASGAKARFFSAAYGTIEVVP
jgi:hypothetical protein